MTFAMKTNYIQSNNNNNRIKPTRAARLALQIMEDSHPDMGFTFRGVRAVLSGILFSNPSYSDEAVRREFYFTLMAAY